MDCVTVRVRGADTCRERQGEGECNLTQKRRGTRRESERKREGGEEREQREKEKEKGGGKRGRKERKTSVRQGAGERGDVGETERERVFACVTAERQ